jgi:serine phosphatase RsbU (regulator of sigma subunit)
MHLTLESGDSMVAFTDGVTDANSPISETYEMTHLEEAIGSAPAEAPALMKHLQTKLVDWVKETPNFDDITLLVLGRKKR